MEPTDWTSIRARFEVFDERTWLNTPTYGPGSRETVAAVERATRDWARGQGDWQAWEGSGERARAGFARLVGADPEDVALVPTVSLAAGQVAAGYLERAGANVVVGADEFRSNLYPWLMLARHGLEVRCPEPGELADAIDARTALVCVSSVQSASGRRTDVTALGRRAHAHGARLFVDATQSVGALQTTVDDVDYLAVGGYKWLLAPRGTGYLYVAPERRDELWPIAAGWKSPRDPYATYYGPPLDLAPDASRFDQSLAWHPWVGAATAFELFDELDPAAVEARCLGLAERFVDGLAELGLAPTGAADERSQIVALEIPDPDGVASALEAAAVHAAVRDRFLRVGFHFFNDEGDVERLLGALDAALTETRSG